MSKNYWSDLQCLLLRVEAVCLSQQQAAAVDGDLLHRSTAAAVSLIVSQQTLT